MKVLVCGDRNWNNYESVKARLTLLPPDTTIIEGNASGADRMAGKAAVELGLPVNIFPAEWDKYGKSAGPIRNMAMLKEKPDLVIAFHSCIWTSRGTLDCLKQASNNNFKIELIQQ